MDLGDGEFWYFFRQLEFRSIETFEIICVRGVDSLECMFSHVCDRVHHFLVALNKPHLNIEHGELSKMPRSGTWLCTIAMSDLKHAFKRTNHDLFVELRTLRKCCSLAKIIEFEYFSTTFGCSSNKLWRVDFNKFVINQIRTKRLCK